MRGVASFEELHQAQRRLETAAHELEPLRAKVREAHKVYLAEWTEQARQNWQLHGPPISPSTGRPCTNCKRRGDPCHIHGPLQLQEVLPA